MTVSEFSCAGIELALFRYPKLQESNLQAWDAADEHLIKHLVETAHIPANTAILNDNFGALQCGLTRLDNTWPLWIETDAKTSLLGAEYNLSANELAPTNISRLNSREQLPNDIKLVIVKLPKNLTYFTQQLQRLSQVLAEGTQILISAKAKNINKSLLGLIEQNLGPASASLTWKKTRIITCTADGIKRSLLKEVSWPVKEFNLTINNFSNVFAANKLDIGARIMLDNMPEGAFKTIIDLGCGNGILGLRAAQLYPQAHIHFVDDSEMAIASSQYNWEANGLNHDQGHFHWDDCLTHLDENVSADLVLCNPPFHQGEAITDHIAWQMFLDAKRRLATGGILHVVGNRHLSYHIKLKRIFKNCTTVASNGKFVILQATK